MNGLIAGRVHRVALALVAVVGTAMTPAVIARASDSPIEITASPSPYGVQLQALTGPTGTDLTIRVADAGSGADPPTALSHVIVTAPAADGRVDVQHFTDVASPGGVATLHTDAVPRGNIVAVRLLFKAGEWRRTFVVNSFTKSLLRPDLVVEEITAPKQVLVGKAVTVTAVIAERNGDVGAEAAVSLSALPGSAERVSVPKGGTATITFPTVTLGDPVPVGLHVTVADATPGETDATNNGASTTVDVSEHELVAADVLVPSLGGYGAQFNQHVYAPITVLPPGATFDDLDTAVKAFEPQLVRVFYNENFEEPGNPRYDPGNVESFRRTVALAQASGATINITYQVFADARLAPEAHMQRFAAELEYLVKTLGYTNVRWVTVANEPNSPGLALTLQQWEALHRALDTELVARGLREHIKIMGGDLVESSGARDHEVWFHYMTTNMADILDAYSEHVYWWYDTFNLEGPWRFEFRLRDIRKLVVDDNPQETRRPAFIMEFGIRGLNDAPGKPTLSNAYYDDGTELRRTNVAAFQQLWFNIASAQLGFVGTSKWDLYWGKYDFTNPPNQSYWALDPTSEGWEALPSYHALRLLLSTTERGWRVVRVDPWERDDWDPLVRDKPEKELVAYSGPSGELTVVGLDTNGRRLNAASTDPPSQYSIGGLPPNTAFKLAVWNATGDGTNSIAGTVVTNSAGVARFEVPLQAAFALTTVAVS